MTESKLHTKIYSAEEIRGWESANTLPPPVADPRLAAYWKNLRMEELRVARIIASRSARCAA